MPVLDMYNKAREAFPEAVGLADKEHRRSWGEPAPEFAYSWFESLANAINRQMMSGVPPVKHANIFRFMSTNYNQGDDEVKNCIDVAFTENLFWQVTPDRAGPYWEIFPTNLRDLYVAFHSRPPL